MKQLREGLAVYLDRRVAAITVLGFASGLPLLLTGGTLSYWLAQEDVDKTDIGLFALVTLPYALKFVWAPALDHVRAPFGAVLGRRRGWLVVVQLALAAALVGLGSTSPGTGPAAVAWMALLVVFLSATQDIVIDAYRIEVLEVDEQGAGAAAIQLGYRLGMLVAGAGAFALSDFTSWRNVYAVMAAVLLVSMIGTLLAPKETAARVAERPTARDIVVDPFLDVLRRSGALWVLAFVLLYKFGDAIIVQMVNPFYEEMGFTGVELAAANKVPGLVASLVGVFVGGALVAWRGLFTALLVGGVLQAVTNLLFAWLAIRGHDVTFLLVAVVADNLTGGLGSAAFVAFLSSLCSPRFAATQYALLSSFMAIGRTMFAAWGGWLADNVSWVAYWALTTLLAVPGIALLLLLRAIGRREGLALAGVERSAREDDDESSDDTATA